MNGRITIKDIAKQAGVSKGTVDRVIHDRGNVSLKAKKSVLAAMKELRYEPNQIASALAYNRNWRIAALLPASEEDSFWQQPRLGVERARNVVRDYGLSVDSYYFNGDHVEEFLKYTAHILADGYDAVLTAPIFLQEANAFFEVCEQRQIPYIQINTYIERSSEYALSYIGQDSYQSGVLAAKLLNFGLAAEETALILHLEKSVINAAHLLEKEKGFEDYFSQHQASKIFTAKASFYDLQDRQQFKKFILYTLRTYPKLKGIFVTTSRLFHLVSALEELNIHHLKLVGYDLIKENLECLRKEKIDFLINQNPIKQGYMGIIGLMNHFVYKRENAKIQHLPLDIVMRENVAYYLMEQQSQLVL